jgi:adenylate cyclase
MQTPEHQVLRQAEIDAEGLVSLLRMFVAASLLVFFFLIVSPVDGLQVDLLRRQWVFAVATMLAYLVMGAVFYGLSRLKRLRHWMIWVALTGDCLFFLLNLRAGLANTDLSGDYVFALPPVWLAPLVMAFGVLRLDPVKQAYALVLMLGGLAWFIFLPGEGSVTGLEDKARLFLSAPPNFIRLVMIALAGVAMIVAAQRMRALLKNSIAEARQKANLTRYLPSRIAGQLANEGLDALRHGTRQEMCVMFIDIRGFTRWAQDRNPQEVTGFITEFRSRVSRVVSDHSGVIDKFMGDAVMVLFDGPGDARSAVACAQALTEEMDDWSCERGDPVRIGIGLHRGEVFCGVVGDTGRLEYSVFGDTVNSASRLEQLTKTSGFAVVVSQGVLNAADETGRGWAVLPPVELRGRSGPVEIRGWRALT